MKKFLCYASLLVLSFGMTACFPVEDDDDVTPYEFVLPEHAGDALYYDVNKEDGSYLMLTEASRAVLCIPQESATRSVTDAKYKTIIGTYAISGSKITLGGDLSGTFDKQDQEISFTVMEDGQQVEVSAVKNTEKRQDNTLETTQICRTWAFSKVICDGNTVTISDEAYARYFEEYGYPKTITFTSYGCIVGEMSKFHASGTWEWSGKNKMKVNCDPFQTEFNFIVDDLLAVEFSVYQYSAERMHDFKVYLVPAQ